MLLDGRSLAEQIEAALRPRVRRLIEAGGPTPGLAALSPSRDEAAAYARLKAAACERVGVSFREVVLAPNATTDAALEQIAALNADASVHGILIQHPLPARLDARACFDRLAPEKDVDAVGTIALGRFVAGESGRAPATVAGVLRLLEHYGISLAGRVAIVAGQGALFAVPMALALLRAGASVAMPGDEPTALRAAIARADILVSGVARPHAIAAAWLPDGAVVIDAGYFNEAGVGDIDIEPARGRLAAYAPVPGGVGPMTVAMLLEATVRAAHAYAPVG